MAKFGLLYTRNVRKRKGKFKENRWKRKGRRFRRIRQTSFENLSFFLTITASTRSWKIWSGYFFFFFVKQWCRVGNEGDGANSRGKQLLAFIFRRTERENTTKEEERKKVSLFNASDAHAPVVPYVYPYGWVSVSDKPEAKHVPRTLLRRLRIDSSYDR